MEILKVESLSKAYGPIQALNKLNLSIQKGQIYGILGPNGSGKTTTLGIITGVLHQDNGSYSWFGGQHKNPYLKIGTILETPNFYPYLNAVENLEIVRHIKKAEQKDFDEILDLVNLLERKKSKFATYSLGMRQRLAIAGTMIGEPEVVIFDEPTNGLDPQGIADVRQTLTNISNMGKTVILASHMLDEVEKICSHVAIIKNGNLLADGNVGAILSSDKNIEVNAQNEEDLLRWLQNQQMVEHHKKTNGYYVFTIDENIDISEVSNSLIQNNIIITHLVERKQSLEEEFLQITQRA